MVSFQLVILNKQKLLSTIKRPTLNILISIEYNKKQ